MRDLVIKLLKDNQNTTNFNLLLNECANKSNDDNSPIDWNLLANYVIENEKFDDLEMVITFDDLANDEKQTAFKAFNYEQHYAYYNLNEPVSFDEFINNYADDYRYYPNGAIFEKA